MATFNAMADKPKREWRPFVMGAIALAAVLAVALGAYLARRPRTPFPRTPFQQEHARLESQNPPGVSVEIMTADSRHDYKEGDVIEIIPSFSSKLIYRYKVQVADGMNAGASNDEVHLSDGSSVRMGQSTLVCCFSSFIGLAERPVIPHNRTKVMFTLKPGDHEMYLTSRRVFRSEEKEPNYDLSSFTVTSPMLRIHVAPAERKP